VVGHVELDPYWRDDMQHLAPDQAALIPALPVLARGGDGPLWVVRVHLAVRHDDIGRGELVEVLGHQWPGAGRVHVQGFFEDQLAQENAGCVLSYAIKHAQEYDVGEVSEGWPVCWQVAYWTWLHGMRRGLQPLRVSVGPQRADQGPALSIIASPRSSAISEPSPRGRGGSATGGHVGVGGGRSSVPDSPWLLMPLPDQCAPYEEPMPVSLGIGVLGLGIRPP
jgi:hypothetical protein